MLRLLGLLLGTATFCNIPVFRYALERWPAAPYDVYVVHRGPLTDEARAVLDVLRQAGANLDVDRINLAESVPEKQRTLLERLKIDRQCLLAVYPGVERVAWWGPLTTESARRLVDSPARREIARRILSGESGVWLLLESGDQAKDDAAAKLLEAELKKQEKVLQLPPHHPNDPPILSEVPVRLAFSVLRLPRTDPAEEPFVRMLLNSEDGLEGPITFPIFGRGRALFAMAGAGHTADNIGEAGAFLVGACSCEAKEFNPGLDLLFAVDWETGLAAPPIKEPVPTPLLKPRPAEPPAPPPADSPPSSGFRPLLWGALVVAGALVVLTGRRVLKSS